MTTSMAMTIVKGRCNKGRGIKDRRGLHLHGGSGDGGREYEVERE